MVLVDTSVLIGFFKKIEGVQYNKMDYIIDNNIPFGICNFENITKIYKNLKIY